MRVRPFFWCLLAAVCVSVLIFAVTIQIRALSNTTTGSCASGTVYTLASTFKESCVDVAKGGRLQIVPTMQAFHILGTGSWVNGKPVPMSEPGALAVNNVQLTTSPVSIGPFSVAGTFYIYCTVHPNMNLTIIVR